ncbi:MAG: efflux RND transporter periplasmic adaptor subunit [Zavarzinella sp.]
MPRKLYSLLFIFLSPLLTSGCKKQPPVAVAPTEAGKITTVRPEKKAVVRLVEQPGTIEAYEEIELHAKLPGFVGKLAEDPNKKEASSHDLTIDIGSKVLKNQILAELDIPEVEEDFIQKTAFVVQAEAHVIQAEKAAEAAKAGVDSGRAILAETSASLQKSKALFERWESEYARVEKLVANGVIDSQTRDETLNQFKAAQANLAEAEAKVKSSAAMVNKLDADFEKAIADITAAKAHVDVAKSDARRADAMRKYTTIRAPFDGIITRRTINRRDFVKADAKQGVFAIARVDPVRVVFHFPENDAGLVEVGQEIDIRLPNQQTVSGKISRTSWSLAPSSRTLRAEVDLSNGKQELRPGMYVHAALKVTLPAQWAVPSSALIKINEELSFYLIEGGKAVRVLAKPGRGDGKTTQVLEYKRLGATAWQPITGNESIASPANLVSDGQTVP